MGDRNISRPSAPELTSGHDVQDHDLTMAAYKVKAMEEIVTDLVDFKKSMTEELCLLRAGSANTSRPKTTTIPNEDEAVNTYPRSDRNIPRPSAAELTSGHDVQDRDLKLSVMEKSLTKVVDFMTSMMEDIRLVRASIVNPSRPKTTAIPNEDVVVNPYPSSIEEEEHAPMTVYQGEDRSVILVVSLYDQKYTNAIYEIKFKGGDMVGRDAKTLVHKPLATFSDDGFLKSARIRSNLYLLLVEDPFRAYPNNPKGGRIFDIKTRSLLKQTIPRTSALDQDGCAVSAYEKLYYFASPTSRKQSLVRYDPDQDVWDPMPHCPFYNGYESRMRIIGYAIYYGVFVLCLYGNDDSYDVIAFHETRMGKEWNKVNVDSCDAPFQERAVVVGKSIYAINMPREEEIVAFSFDMVEGDGGDIEYSLIKQFVLHGLQIEQPPFEFCLARKQFLIHLGNQDFFHIKISPCESIVWVQYVCITMFQIVVQGGGHMIKTLHSTVFPLDMEGCRWFELMYCFTPLRGRQSLLKVV
ncbi:PREDICTED: uncharacterized protein LOC103336655 isoform X2 [Prunus mume]|uniref:Uncharacterized protein LOC103336655 isoform X2 n=1 Tax=Prunus mume TaxID=102107 RepID=A0ABM1LVC4_PRUMU|nr:PREDICTED: uncharacterized protein LOC103336655 isoform X2 [Prunus mume]